VRPSISTTAILISAKIKIAIFNIEMSAKEMRAIQKMNRMERKAMADSRAMEEQMERHNPISGTGATPSMGLSQVRGGKKMMMNAVEQGKQLAEHLASLHGGAYAQRFHEGMSGGLRTGRYEGEGAVSDIGHKLSDMLPGPYGKFGHSVSKLAGLFGLGKPHMNGGFLGMLASIGIPLIAKLLGAGKMSQNAHDQLKKMMEDHEKKHHSGKMKGGFWGMLASVGIPLIANLLGAGEMTKGAHDQLKKMFKKGEMEGSGKITAAEKKALKSVLEKHEMDGGAMFSPDEQDFSSHMMGSGHCDGRSVGAGQCGGRRDPVPYGRPQRPVMELMGEGRYSDIGHNLSNVAEAFGPNRVGTVGRSLSNIAGMFGLGKQKRVVGAGDGRRKRAEVVKKVMADQGLSMIEASKFVKEHGLYQP
jgi:hypothetical protein